MHNRRGSDFDIYIGHQMALPESLELPHCLGLPYLHYQLVLSLYLHQLESHQKFQKGVSLSLFKVQYVVWSVGEM